MKKILLWSNLLIFSLLSHSATATWGAQLPSWWLLAGGWQSLKYNNATSLTFNKTAIYSGATSTTIASILVGVVAGLESAKFMNRRIYHQCEDQPACDAAKLGNYAGVAIGTASTIATITIVGVDAAGLATVGSIVGGSIVAGATILVLIPVITAVLIGGATYGVSHWWFKNEESTQLETSIF